MEPINGVMENQQAFLIGIMVSQIILMELKNALKFNRIKDGMMLIATSTRVGYVK